MNHSTASQKTKPGYWALT